jgi:hypothetical protein
MFPVINLLYRSLQPNIRTSSSAINLANTRNYKSGLTHSYNPYKLYLRNFEGH